MNSLKFFFLFLNLIVTPKLYSQLTFFANPKDTTYKYINQVIEFNSNYYICGSSADYYNLDNSIRNKSAYIEKINANGFSVSSSLYSDLDYDYFNCNILLKEDTVILISLGSNNSGSHLKILKYDNQLNYCYSKKINFLDSVIIYSVNALELDSQILLTGVATKDPNDINKMFSYIGKISFQGDSISFKTYQKVWFESSFQFKNSEYIVTSRVVSNCGSGFYYFSQQLDSIDFICNSLFNNINSHKTNRKIGVNKYVISGGHYNNKKECTWLTDSLFNTIKYIELSGIDTSKDVYPAVNGCVDFNGKFIYQSWTEEFNPFLYDLNNSANHITIAKLDTLLNQIWTYNYGDNESYFMVFHIIATSDGGCLATGYSSNQFHQENNLDYFLLKIDSLGNYVWMQKMPTNTLSLQIFPNPSSDQFYLKNLPQGERVEQLQLFDMNGKKVLSIGAVEAQEAIDIRQLPQGMYLVEVSFTNGQRLTTKLVKASGDR